jgi:deoxyribodipyrimidine photolyase-related protein
MKRLILILGDQLSPSISSLRAADPARDVVLMAEVTAETTYVRHHKKKIVLVLAAMRHFAEELSNLGWMVDYVRLDDPDNTGSLYGEAHRALARHGATNIVATEPGEWRLMEDMSAWAELLPDTRYLADRQGFVRWAEARKTCAWSISIG